MIFNIYPATFALALFLTQVAALPPPSWTPSSSSTLTPPPPSGSPYSSPTHTPYTTSSYCPPSKETHPPGKPGDYEPDPGHYEPERPPYSNCVVTGAIEVRDDSGNTVLGFMGNVDNTSGQSSVFDVIGVVDPSEPTSDRMQAQWSSISDTLVATNLVFSPPPPPLEPPYYLNGASTLFLLFSKPSDLLVTGTPGGVSWYYNFQTQELTGYIDKMGIGPEVSFLWDQTVNRLTVWPESDFPGYQHVRFFLVPVA